MKPGHVAIVLASIVSTTLAASIPSGGDFDPSKFIIKPTTSDSGGSSSSSSSGFFSFPSTGSSDDSKDDSKDNGGNDATHFLGLPTSFKPTETHTPHTPTTPHTPYSPYGSPPEVHTTGYNPGHTTTYNPGHTPSYNPGHTPSYNPGHTTSYNPGHTTTYNPGHTTTYNPGHTTTYNLQPHSGYALPEPYKKLHDYNVAVGTECRYYQDFTLTTEAECDADGSNRRCRWDVSYSHGYPPTQIGKCLCSRTRYKCDKDPKCYWSKGYHEHDGECISNAEKFYSVMSKLLLKRGKKDFAIRIAHKSAPARGLLPYGPHGPGIYGFGSAGSSHNGGYGFPGLGYGSHYGSSYGSHYGPSYGPSYGPPHGPSYGPSYGSSYGHSGSYGQSHGQSYGYQNQYNQGYNSQYQNNQYNYQDNYQDNYNQQGDSYSSDSSSGQSYDEGYGGNDQGYGDNDQGYSGNDQGYGGNDQGYSGNDQGYSKNQGYGQNYNQGYGQSYNQGYNQGYGNNNHHALGFQFNRHGCGGPNCNTNYNKPPYVYNNRPYSFSPYGHIQRPAYQNRYPQHSNNQYSGNDKTDDSY